MFDSSLACLSVVKDNFCIKHGRGFQGPVDFSSLHRIQDLVLLLHFLFKRLFTHLQFHNTSGCLSQPSEISVLIRAAFKGKIRAQQIRLNPPVTHFTAIYNVTCFCDIKTKVPVLLWWSDRYPQRITAPCFFFLLEHHQTLKILKHEANIELFRCFWAIEDDRWNVIDWLWLKRICII